MKIGTIMQKYGISRETLHYYIRIGLLNPTKQNGQYDFSEREEQDIEEILRLKSMHFRLEEIIPILNWKSFSIGMDSGLKEKYLMALLEKEEEISQQRRELEKCAEDIRQEMKQILHGEQISATKIGVPLAALSMLVCPKCGRHLEFSGTNFNYRYLYQGELHCSCGYYADIKDGIICTGNRDNGTDDSPDLERTVYKMLDNNFVKAHRTCANKVKHQLEAILSNGKVIMEGNVNNYFLLYNHLEGLDKECLYIFVDKYEETLLMYREMIEQAGLELNILFIADAKNELPLASECVDILVSFFGENGWSLYHDEVYLKSSKRYLKKGAVIMGSHLSYAISSKSRKNLHDKYPRSSSRCYNIDYLIQDYKEQGVALYAEKTAEITYTESGHCLSCHQQGEVLSVYYILSNV